MTILKSLKQGLVPLIGNPSSSSNVVKVTNKEIRLLVNKIKAQPKVIRKPNLLKSKFTRNSLLLGKYRFHTSSILFSGQINNPQNTIVENTATKSSSSNSIENQLKERSERLLIEETRIESRDEQGSNFERFLRNSAEYNRANSSNISEWEAYPWLRSHIPNMMISEDQPLSLFNSVAILRLYLEHNFHIDPSRINEGILTKILEPFNTNETITVREFLEHISSLQSQDPDFISKLNTSDSLNESSDTISNSSETINTTDNVVVPRPRPLGDAGEITVNQIVHNALNLNWPPIFDALHITAIQPLDILVHTAPYSLLMRTWIRVLHNRPYPQNISPASLIRLRQIRRLQLVGFAFFGAPAIMYSLRFSAVSFRDMVRYEIRPVNPDSNNIDNNQNSNINNSALILTMLANFKNNKPNWFKFLALLIVVILLSLKIGGLSNFWFVYSNIGLTLTISYQLVNLYLLYLTEKKKQNIPFIFPDFIRNWLKKEFEELSQCNEEEINIFKNEYYLYLFLYLALFILELVIFF